MAASPGTTPVGFVGLGNIGRPMVQALLNAGWDVAVLDRVPDRAHELADAGASVAKSLTDLADCEILVLAVPDDAAVESVLEGPDGWLEQSGEGRTVIVHSTVLPETAARLSQVCVERGVGLLDAPVSGGADRAAKGDLTIMIGGDPNVVERVRPLLDSEGSQVLMVGAAGAGAATKLANQLMMLSALAGAHEALDLAAAHGVAAEKVFEVVASSTGDSWVARNWGFFDRTSAAYDAAGTPPSERPWSKDLFEVVAAARAADLRVPVAGLLAQTLADRVEAHAAAARDGQR
jgi:3-hydroxyisobutyrate dehydrogenase